jgi:predicted nucleotidyltransferase component of viral defense system
LEPNEVIRGTVFPCEERRLIKKREDFFELSTSVRTLSVADLYGGKLCAALDRQHPRDLFDVKLLMDEEGISDEIRTAFAVHLASHNRVISDLIAPRLMEIKEHSENE